MFNSLLNIIEEGLCGLTRVFVGPSMDKFDVKEYKKAAKEAKKEVTKNKAAEKKKKEEKPAITAPLKPLTWSDQAWLSAFMPKYLGRVHDSPWVTFDDAPVSFKHVRNAIKLFLSLGTKELSILQPYFKLEKITEKGKPVRYPITLLQRDIDKTARSNQKVEYVQIKGVNIERQGKMVGDQNLKISMELEASSYKAFTTPRKTGVSLMDFLKRNVSHPRDTTAPRDHVMRLEIGWADPSGAKLNNLQKEGLINAATVSAFANQSRIKLSGILLDHNIGFEQDGSMKITLTYQGVLDTLIDSPRANILFDPRGDVYTKRGASLERILARVENAPTIALKKKYEEEYRKKQKAFIKEAYAEIIKQMAARNGVYYTIVKNVNHITVPGQTPNYPKYKTGVVRMKGEVDPPDLQFQPAKIIKFFPLGELIKFFVDNALSKQKRTIGGKSQIGKTQQYFKIRVGNINFSHRDELYKTNIGMLPVSYELFQKWFVTFLTGNQRTQITLYEFLQRMLRGLAMSTFERFNDIPIPGANAFSPQFELHLRKKKQGKHEELFLTAKQGYENELSLAPNFILGGAQAVVKSFAFNKVDIKGFREAQISSTSLARTAIAKGYYKIQLELFGTALFSNGMLIRIDPRGLGISAGADKRGLGLGGYYIITRTYMKWSMDGMYTTVEATFTRPLVQDDQEKKKYIWHGPFAASTKSPYASKSSSQMSVKASPKTSKKPDPTASPYGRTNITKAK